jgi:hypothetical protein
MKVLLTKDNIIHNSFWPIGSIVEVTDEEARELIEKKEAATLTEIFEDKEVEEPRVPKKKADK